MLTNHISNEIFLDEITEIHDGNASQAAARAIEVYKMARSRAKKAQAPWKELQNKAREVIERTLEILDTDKIESDAGVAYIQADSRKPYYDAEALDELCLNNPQIRDILWPYREIRTRRGGPRVR